MLGKQRSAQYQQLSCTSLPQTHTLLDQAIAEIQPLIAEAQGAGSIR